MPDLSESEVQTTTIWAGVLMGQKTRVVLKAWNGEVVAEVQYQRAGGHDWTPEALPWRTTEIIGQVYTSGLVEGRKIGIHHERDRCLAHARQCIADESELLEQIDPNGSLAAACAASIDAAEGIAHVIASGEQPKPNVAAEVAELQNTEQSF